MERNSVNFNFVKCYDSVENYVVYVALGKIDSA